MGSLSPSLPLRRRRALALTGDTTSTTLSQADTQQAMLDFDPTDRIIDQLGLDASDPAVTAATAVVPAGASGAAVRWADRRGDDGETDTATRATTTAEAESSA